MSNATVTIKGNLGRGPDLRYSTQGKPWASLRVAVNERHRNPETREWEDGETTWWGVTAFGALAEAAAEVLDRGMPVVVEGRFEMDEYETREGEARREPTVIASGIALPIHRLARAPGKGQDTRLPAAGEPRHSAESASQDQPF